MKKGIVKERDEMQYFRFVSESDLTFQFKENGEWLEILENFQQEDSGTKALRIAQFSDYLANPAVIYKNYTMINMTMAQITPALYEDQQLFSDVLGKIDSLLYECYDLIDCTASMDQNREIDEAMLEYFDKEMNNLSKKTVQVHGKIIKT